MSLAAPSRLQFRVHPAGLAVLAGLLVAARVRSLAPGNGPGFALLAALASALLLDAGWSLVVLRRRGLVVTARAASDGTVGQPAPLLLEVTGRRAPLLVRVSSIRSASWLKLDAPSLGEVVTMPERRGEFTGVDVSLLHTAPLGLVGVIRTVVVTLPVPILIGPRPERPDELSLPPGPRDLEAAERPAPGAEAELVRSARPYQPGDDLRRVHWPLTARSGEVMVRELDALRRPVVVVLADLGPQPGERAERAASLAAGLAGRALERGLPVVLVTREESGVRSAAVTGAVEVGRRLALAAPGVAPELPTELAADHPLVRVDADGYSWQWRGQGGGHHMARGDGVRA